MTEQTEQTVEATPNARYLRQLDIVPLDKLAQVTASVVGVGAIGRQVALQLAAIGVPRLHLWDFDTVEVHNLAAQGYHDEDIGRRKTAVTLLACMKMNTSVDIHASPSRYRRPECKANVVFCCVDSMSARERIFRSCVTRPPIGRDHVLLFLDGRMTVEFLQVMAVYSDETQEYYKDNFFTDEEAFEGRCTARSTIFCANLAAGVMVSTFTKWLRGIPMDKDVTWNIMGNNFKAVEGGDNAWVV